MTTDDYEPPSRERLLAIIDQLCAEWLEFVTTPGREFVRPRDADEPLTAALVLALASHATELGTGVSTLVRSGFSGMAVMPMVRSAYESAITAHWLAQMPDAAAAFINEDARNREALALDLPNAKGKVFRESAEVIRRKIIPKLSTSSDSQARRFRQRCLDLELGGVDAYVYYRVASSLTHPSVLVTDQYLLSIDDSLHIQPHAHPMGDHWTFLAAASLVWAQMAANYCDPSRARRTSLRLIGHELGIEPDLKLSSAARSRASAKRAN